MGSTSGRRSVPPTALPGGVSPTGNAPEKAAVNDGQAPSSEPSAPLGLAPEPGCGAFRGCRFDGREGLSLLG
jgi:hypothetical protein